MATSYEWTVERITDGDIEELRFFDTPEEMLDDVIDAMNEYTEVDFGLVKRIGNDIDGEQHRTYAYVNKGDIAKRFDDGTPVPKTQLAKMDRAWKRHAQK